MSNRSSPLHDSEFLRAFLDVVIPASADGSRPSAGSLGLEERLTDAIETDPVLGPFVRAGLEAIDEAAREQDPTGLPGLSPDARLELIQGRLAAHPMLMIGVVRHLYPAYYQHPRVLAALGEPRRAPFPEGYEIEATDPALLDLLMARRRSP